MDAPAQCADPLPHAGQAHVAAALELLGRRVRRPLPVVPHVEPKRAQTMILQAALELSVALQDGQLTLSEIRASRSTLENARDAIDAQLAKLKPQGVSA